jgi:hypothetical protein
MERNTTPFFRYTYKERMNVTCEEYYTLIEDMNDFTVEAAIKHQHFAMQYFFYHK